MILLSPPTWWVIKKEWDALFLELLISYIEEGKLLDGVTVTRHHDDILLGPNKLYSGTKSIIDDILIWSSNLPEILLYFECVCQVF